MAPHSLGPSNVFFIFSGLAVLGSMYSYFVLKESRGLTDKDKKLLFTPQKYILQANEEIIARETHTSKISADDMDSPTVVTESERPSLAKGGEEYISADRL